VFCLQGSHEHDFEKNMIKNIQTVIGCSYLGMAYAASMGWIDPALLARAEIGVMAAEIVIVQIERHLEEKEQ